MQHENQTNENEWAAPRWARWGRPAARGRRSEIRDSDGSDRPGGRRHGRGGRHGGPPWGTGGGFGPGFGPRGAGRAKVRRGETRDAVLLLLLEGPKHGYQLMTELNERSNGRWNPSPGSIYPVVRTLAEAGLVSVDEIDGRRDVSLTESGRVVAERLQTAGAPPWEQFHDEHPSDAFREAAFRLLPALRQLADEGTPAALAQITAQVDALRREVYRVLGDPPEESEHAGVESADETPSAT